jgi:hypothetical protein
MWPILVMAGLFKLGILLSLRSYSGSPREAPSRITYSVHGYWAPRGYTTEVSFIEESAARSYADQELAAHPDMHLAVAVMTNNHAGTILRAHPPDYNPWRAP